MPEPVVQHFWPKILHFSCSIIPNIPSSIMVLYCVYRATYKTRRGTRRAYIGYSGNLDVRKYWHKVRPPAWMKPQRDDTLDVVILEPGIKSVGLARAAEAMYAAREILKAPQHTRGGPWLKPAWGNDWRRELEAVSKIRSISKLSEYAETNPEGNVQQHLKNFSYHPSREAVEGEATCRGACARRVKRSGTPGNQSRKAQVGRGVLKRPSAYYVRIHRGVDAPAARKKENAKRRAQS
jgi:hypothetical protein